jgi:hypothetical protein
MIFAFLFVTAIIAILRIEGEFSSQRYREQGGLHDKILTGDINDRKCSSVPRTTFLSINNESDNTNSENDYNSDEEYSDRGVLIKVFAVDQRPRRIWSGTLTDFFSDEPDFENWEATAGEERAMDEKLHAFIDKIAKLAERPRDDVRAERKKEKKKQQRNKSNWTTQPQSNIANAGNGEDCDIGAYAHKKCPAATTPPHGTTQPEGEKPTPRSLQRVRSERTHARGGTASTTQYAKSNVPYSAESSKLDEPNTVDEGRDNTVPHRRSERIRATHLQRDLVEVNDEGGSEARGGDGDEEGDGEGDEGDEDGDEEGDEEDSFLYG